MTDRSPLAGLHPHAIFERLCELGTEWADLQAAASLFEETKGATLARLTVERMDERVSRAQAETLALASDEWLSRVEGMVEAKKAAQRAMVRWKSALMWAELLRSQNATRREEMRLGGMVP